MGPFTKRYQDYGSLLKTLFLSVIALEQGDTYAKDILMHFNISQMFFRDKYQFDAGIQRMVILPNATQDNSESIKFIIVVSSSNIEHHAKEHILIVRLLLITFSFISSLSSYE